MLTTWNRGRVYSSALLAFLWRLWLLAEQLTVTAELAAIFVCLAKTYFQLSSGCERVKNLVPMLKNGLYPCCVLAGKEPQLPTAILMPL